MSNSIVWYYSTLHYVCISSACVSACCRSCAKHQDKPYKNEKNISSSLMSINDDHYPLTKKNTKKKVKTGKQIYVWKNPRFKWLKEYRSLIRNRDYHFKMPIEYVAVHQHDPFSLHTKLEGPWAMTIRNQISISQPVAPWWVSRALRNLLAMALGLCVKRALSI